MPLRGRLQTRLRRPAVVPLLCTTSDVETVYFRSGLSAYVAPQDCNFVFLVCLLAIMTATFAQYSRSAMLQHSTAQQ